MNKAGFMMPTVLAFILITSSALLYQSCTLISQLYSLYAASNDMIKLEYAVNVRRVIKEFEVTDSCSYERLLDYEEQDHKLAVATNCIYLETDNQAYNEQVLKLSSRTSLSAEQFDEIKAKLITLETETDSPLHEQELGGYTERQSIVLVSYQLQTAYNRVLIVDSKENVINNIEVK